ncbi:hypothetical protein MRX96_051567, partial [Rhipicephalus microplus]
LHPVLAPSNQRSAARRPAALLRVVSCGAAVDSALLVAAVPRQDPADSVLRLRVPQRVLFISRGGDPFVTGCGGDRAQPAA